VTGVASLEKVMNPRWLALAATTVVLGDLGLAQSQDVRPAPPPWQAFLAGPPLVGLLAEPGRLGILPALLVVLVALVVGGAVAGRAAPPTP